MSLAFGRNVLCYDILHFKIYISHSQYLNLLIKCLLSLEHMNINTVSVLFNGMCIAFEALAEYVS